MAPDPSRPYFLPRRVLSGADAAEALAAGEALPLAGGPLAFTHVEILRRGRRDTEARGPFPWATLPASGGVPAGAWAEWRVKLSSPRPLWVGLDLSRPRLMGILNVTPDSFSDGGRHADIGHAVAHAHALVDEGADILDIGGESTRPGAAPIELQEETARVLPVIAALAGQLAVPISIDTRKAAVMRAATTAGAVVVNDVSALRHDPEAIGALRDSGACAVLMHMRGEPQTMQDNPAYDDVLLDVYDHLAERVAACIAAGIPRERLAVDPGIGFGKTFAHNLRLMQNLALFHGLGCPILLGASRKGFLRRLGGEPAPADRLAGSLAAVLAALAQGVQMFRVHDVAETRRALAVWRAVRDHPSGAGPDFAG